VQRLPLGPEPDDQGGPSAHVGDADAASTADVTRLAADRVGVLDIMSGDLRGSTALSAACFGPDCSQKRPRALYSPTSQLRLDPLSPESTLSAPFPQTPIPATMTTTYPRTLAQPSICLVQ
jgi:hypothetical protein